MSGDGDDDWKPSPEEEAQMDEFYRLAERHPTFLIILKIVQSRARLKRLIAMQGPEQVVQRERQMLDQRLDELCAAMPYVAELEAYPLLGIIQHFRDELRHAPGSGDDA